MTCRGESSFDFMAARYRCSAAVQASPVRGLRVDHLGCFVDEFRGQPGDRAGAFDQRFVVRSATDFTSFQQPWPYVRPTLAGQMPVVIETSRNPRAHRAAMPPGFDL